MSQIYANQLFFKQIEITLDASHREAAHAAFSSFERDLRALNPPPFNFTPWPESDVVIRAHEVEFYRISESRHSRFKLAMNWIVIALRLEALEKKR